MIIRHLRWHAASVGIKGRSSSASRLATSREPDDHKGCTIPLGSPPTLLWAGRLEVRCQDFDEYKVTKRA